MPRAACRPQPGRPGLDPVEPARPGCPSPQSRAPLRRVLGWAALGAVAALVLPAPYANAQPRIDVVGFFPEGAILVIDGSPPRTLRVGQVSPEGVRLVAADGREAVVEAGGRRQSLPLGQAIATQRPTGGRQQAILQGDRQGHFWASGEINGASVRMLVYTGATLITLSAGMARRLGVNYLSGTPTQTSTANGLVRGWKVTLAQVRVGDITLHGIEAAVHEGDNLPIILLGMSFLNRVEMQRDGDRMTLLRRF